jgi:hypothetical protein
MIKRLNVLNPQGGRRVRFGQRERCASATIAGEDELDSNVNYAVKYYMSNENPSKLYGHLFF